MLWKSVRYKREDTAIWNIHGMAKLVDFDQNGREELLLTYADSKAYDISAEACPNT